MVTPHVVVTSIGSQEEAAQVLLVARAFDEGDPAGARRLLAGRWRGEGALARVDALLGEALFARGDALSEGRVHAANGAPLSLRRAALAAMDARTPILRFGRAAASRAIAAACADAAIIDGLEVGGGDTAPWTELVDLLALRRRPPRLRVAALRRGGQLAAGVEIRRDLLAAHARRRGVPFEWSEIEGPRSAVVEGALALHVDGVFDAGPKVELASLRPRVVTSVEIAADGGEGSLLRRVAWLRERYRRIFEALEARVDARARSILERECFGRALLDRVAEAEAGPGAVGGSRRDLAPLTVDAGAVAGEIGGYAGFSARAVGPALTLCWRGEPLLRASAWADRGRG